MYPKTPTAKKTEIYFNAKFLIFSFLTLCNSQSHNDFFDKGGCDNGFLYENNDDMHIICCSSFHAFLLYLSKFVNHSLSKWS